MLQLIQMNNLSKRIKLFLLHSSVWFFFILVILLQSPDISSVKFWYEIIVFLLTGVLLSYLNLYVFFPRLFLKKKHMEFWLILLATTAFISFLNTSLFINFNKANYPSIFLANFFNLLLISLVIAGIKYIGEDLPKLLMMNELAKLQLKTELNLLKSQVNPHFLFNTLNNLYGLITQNQNAQASEITLKLGDLMRYLLESSKMERVSLDKEIQFMEDYLALEKIRLSQDADIRFEVSGINRKIFIAPLLFIPLVENAFKHGINTILADSFAHFSLSVQGSEIYFEAINSVGKPPENSELSGTGLQNLKQRLQLIYPNRHQLDIEQTTNQFKAILHIKI